MQTKSQILTLIKSIGRRGKTLDSDIQIACIHSVFYSVCYGDVTIGQSLLEHFPSGSRKAAMVNFLETFGQFEAKDKTLVYRKNDKLTEYLEDVAGTGEYCDNIKTHWTALKPEKITSIFNCKDAVKSLIVKMEREIKAGTAQHSEVYDVIAKAFAEYNGEAEEETVEDKQAEFERLASELGYTMEEEVTEQLTGTNG